MILALLLLVAVPHDASAIRENVACIERNSYHNDEGGLVFRQYIFFDWECDGHVVVAWRLDKGEFSFTEHPPTLIWADGESVRIVRAEYWRESWTQYDPELAERERLPAEQRRGLRSK